MPRYRAAIRPPGPPLSSVFVGAALAVAAQAWAQDGPLGARVAASGAESGAPACASCHGPNGEGNAAAGFPRLAGLHPGYIELQLAHFADGSRANAVMGPIAKQLTDAERNAVAAHYGGLAGSAPVAISAADVTDASDIGAWLATRGRWDDELPACEQCHGPGGVGVGETFPPLAGQPAAYIAAQLHAFRDATRPAGPLDLMGVVAKKLSDADIAAVAEHFAAARGPVAQPERRKE